MMTIVKHVTCVEGIDCLTRHHAQIARSTWHKRNFFLILYSPVKNAKNCTVHPINGNEVFDWVTIIGTKWIWTNGCNKDCAADNFVDGWRRVCVLMLAIPLGAMEQEMSIMISTLTTMERIHGVITIGKTGNAISVLFQTILIATTTGSVKVCVVTHQGTKVLLLRRLCILSGVPLGVARAQIQSHDPTSGQ